MLNSENLYLLLPLIILGATAIIAMLAIAIKRNHMATYVLSLIGTAAAFGSLFYLPTEGHKLTTLFVVDGFSSFFTGLVLVATFFIIVFSYPYFKNMKIKKGEYYILLLLASFGAIAMVISNHFVAFFLSLEVMSVSLYAMIGYLKKSPFAIEAAIKYLIMAGVSSSILLFGFALIYAQTGEMELTAMMAAGADTTGVLFVSGMALVIVGLGFKLALVPFHMWTPDIYAGAPAPVSTFVATISKGSVMAFLIRLFIEVNGEVHNGVWVTFAVFAIASMLIGNWLALRQNNVKRLLAYSSIGHLGYMVVALLAASQAGVEAVAYYLVAYFISMTAAFGIIGYLSNKDGELLNIDDYKGLFWKKPWIAALFAGVLLSLAGIPLTAGFLGKFYLLLSGVGSGLWLLVTVLIVSSTIGLFYYLRVVIALFAGKDEVTVDTQAPAGASVFAGIVLVALFIFLFWAGMFPSGLVEIIQNLVTPVIG